jgi:hypothetical protein
MEETQQQADQQLFRVTLLRYTAEKKNGKSVAFGCTLYIFTFGIALHYL